MQTRQKAFNQFISYCQQMIDIQQQDPQRAIEFIRSLLRPNIDARVFEIVSYAILKEYYGEQKIYWGWSPDRLNSEYLLLYKTGRTNANDGGIDFVMKPLGRFFQVTETIAADKYFLIKIATILSEILKTKLTLSLSDLITRGSGSDTTSY